MPREVPRDAPWRQAHWWRTRTCSVRRPRSSSAASNGPRMPPSMLRIRAARSKCASLRAKTSAPATTSEWPFRYFVAECMTTSAPSAIGFMSTGVGTVESTASTAPAVMGDARRLGDVGDGPQRVGRRLDPHQRVLPGRTPARMAAGSPASTKVASMPRPGASSSSHLRRPQYMTLGATTCAGRSSARKAVVAAVMPEAEHQARRAAFELRQRRPRPGARWRCRRRP